MPADPKRRRKALERKAAKRKQRHQAQRAPAAAGLAGGGPAAGRVPRQAATWELAPAGQPGRYPSGAQVEDPGRGERGAGDGGQADAPVPPAVEAVTPTQEGERSPPTYAGVSSTCSRK
jgi:hypothetical protein